MSRPTKRNRFRYWFDNLMSKGVVSLVGVLFAFSAVVIVLTGAVGALIGGDDGESPSLLHNVWQSFNHTLDAGTLSGDSGSVLFIFLMAIVTIFGLFITSMLIGIISNGISDKVESLRKGRSIVVEEGHTIVLGFDQIAIGIIRQLVAANANQPRACVVVMDDRDKTEMEDAIHEALGRTGRTRVVCRSGRIDSLSDIAILSPQTCKAIIVNAPDDYLTTKAVLASARLIAAAGGGAREGSEGPFVCAVVRDRENIAPMLVAGQGHAEVFYFETVISRMMAQTLRRPGISQVFNELLSFDGTEVYVEPAPRELVGKSLEEANRRLPLSTVIGIMRGGESLVNPGRGVAVREGDALILLAPDDGVSEPGPAAPVDEGAFAPVRKGSDARPDVSLILGCNGLVRSIVREADAYAAAGSRVVVAASRDLIDQAGLPEKGSLANLAVDVRACDVFDSPTLAGLMGEQPRNVLILSDENLADDEADARVLMLLLQLYGFRNGSDPLRRFSVTCQLRNVENQQLAQVTDVADFVISSNVTAMMMTQVSESRAKRPVIEELLSSRGSEIYMKPASRYVACGRPCSFHTVKSSVARYGEVAIGLKRLAADGTFSIRLNPPGSEVVELGERDRVIVIAQNAE